MVKWGPFKSRYNKSVLGLLLFLIFINDLPGCLAHTTPNMYADDTSITMGNENFNLMENRINEDLQNLCIWLRANHLSLNIVKSEYMIIGSVQQIRNLRGNLHYHQATGGT